MPRNGSGTYTKAGSDFVSGTLADAAAVNAQIDDIATALTGSVAKDGQTAITGDLQMGGNQLTGLGDGAAAGDSVSLGQAQKSVYAYADSGGTADIITATLSPAITSYTDGMSVIVRGAATNTSTAPTLNLNAVGAKTIFKAAAAGLVAGDIAGDNHDLYLTYNTSLNAAAGGWTLANPQSTQSINIVGLSALTTAATDDLLAISDTSDSNNVKKITAVDFLEVLNALTEDTNPLAADDYLMTFDASASTVKKIKISNLRVPEVWMFALSDETTTITAATNKLVSRVPYAFTVTAVRGTLRSSGTAMVIDINMGGSTILSTKLSFDSGELTTTTAATAAVISVSALTDDAILAFDVDSASGTPAGLKVFMYGYRTA